MTIVLSGLLQSGRVAAIALVLGGVSLAVPAMADNGPAFNFGIHAPHGDMRMGDRGPRHFQRQCLNDDDIAAELEDAGWHRVQVGGDVGHFQVLAFGSWGHRPYQMTVDRCSGEVGRVRPAFDNQADYSDQSGFGRHHGDFGRGADRGRGPGFNSED